MFLSKYARLKCRKYNGKHMLVARRVLRYVKETEDQKLVLRPGKNDQLTAYIELVWGPETDAKRRILSMFMIMYGGVFIHGTSSLQKSFAPSSTEAEYIALSEVSRTMIWFRNVLKKIEYTSTVQRCIRIIRGLWRCQTKVMESHSRVKNTSTTATATCHNW